MQGYNPSFARIYNLRWNYFAQQVAPRIRALYEATLLGQENHHLLDLCCGAGHLAQYFLDNGYQVTGLDLSEAMLHYARANTAPYLITGQVEFVQGDASAFHLDQQFGLVVSTFDALNHLPSMESLKSSFDCVFNHLAEGGMFVFDLNTRYGLSRWTSISVEDSPELMLVMRALYDEGQGRAHMRVSGFVKSEDGDGRYERFEETAYETVFDLAEVEAGLRESGFRAVRFARSQELNTAVAEPERESRIFIIAEK